MVVGIITSGVEAVTATVAAMSLVMRHVILMILLTTNVTLALNNAQLNGSHVLTLQAGVLIR